MNEGRIIVVDRVTNLLFHLIAVPSLSQPFPYFPPDWDFAADEGFQNVYYNNMYKSIRILSAKHNLYFAIWCTNETEFYDLRKEPWQLRNTESEMDPRLKTRMEALVKTMKECKGKGCRDPWSVIHPDGSVKDLDDAMDPVSWLRTHLFSAFSLSWRLTLLPTAS